MNDWAENTPNTKHAAMAMTVQSDASATHEKWAKTSV